MTVGEFFERIREAAGGDFADLGLLVGDPEAEVRSIAVGIEVGVEEIRRAARLREEGKGPDLLLSHHFSQLGGGRIDVRKVLERQREALVEAGVPERRALKLTLKLATLKEMEAGMRSDEPLRLALKFALPLGVVHTPADLFAERHLKGMVRERKPSTLEELVEALRPIPEYQKAEGRGERLAIILGSPKRPVGGLFYCVSIGWNPLPEAFEELGRAGRVRTVLTTSATAALVEACKKAGLNLVELPHYGTDSLGLNLLLDAILPEEVIIEPCAHFIRVRRGG